MDGVGEDRRGVRHDAADELHRGEREVQQEGDEDVALRLVVVAMVVAMVIMVVAMMVVPGGPCPLVDAARVPVAHVVPPFVFPYANSSQYATRLPWRQRVPAFPVPLGAGNGTGK